MLDLFERTNWDSAYFFLTSGSPSLMIQLLAINTIFLILFILRRMTGVYNKKAHTSYVVQALLIIGNAAVLMQNDLMPYASKVLTNLKVL